MSGTDDVRADGGAGRREEQLQDLLAARPHPPLPREVAIAGNKLRRQYLYRPGELVAWDGDLDRDGGYLRKRLADLGAEQLREPPTGAEAATSPLRMLDRDPTGDAVRHACDNLKGESESGGTPAEELRLRFEERISRFATRGDGRRERGRQFLDQMNLTMYRLPPGAPMVPSLLKELRAPRAGVVPRISANLVMTGEQDWIWGPGSKVHRLGPGRQPLPDEPGTGNAGSGVRLAVLDTGIRVKHDWLTEVESRGDDDYEELDENGDSFFDHEAGHGTFIAGIVRQQAPGTTIRAHKVVDADGFTDDIAVAVELAALIEFDIDIINLSLGGPADPTSPAPYTRLALDLLRNRNHELTVVAAAGNQARSIPFYPAAFADVISVGALGRDNRRAPFSNHGSWVRAWALGVGITSSYVAEDVNVTPTTDPGGNDGALWSGTSFAAPRVAGAIAAAMSRGS